MKQKKHIIKPASADEIIEALKIPKKVVKQMEKLIKEIEFQKKRFAPIVKRKSRARPKGKMQV